MLEYWVDNVYSIIYDEILDLAKKYKIWVAIWWVFRPSNIQESLDDIHIKEIELQEYYIQKGIEKWVTIIRQWPGHMPLNDIKRFTDIIKKENDVPYMSLWPIVSDYISVWYDSYSNVIWAYELSKFWKADIINWVSDYEHTGEIPPTDAAIKWYIAARICAYLINSAKSPKQIKDFEKPVAEMKLLNNTCKMSGSPILEKNVFAIQKCFRCWVWDLCPCHIKVNDE